jgi:hypothetical protein
MAQEKSTMPLVLIGLTLTVLLAVTGVLLTIGSSSTKSTVHDQLDSLKISFPAKGAPGMTPELNEYAGQQVDTGDEAKKYADVFLGNILKAAGGGKTFSQLFPPPVLTSSPQQEAQMEALFRGETAQSLLVDAYGFEGMAKLMMTIAWICYIGAVILLALSVLGAMGGRGKAAATS